MYERMELIIILIVLRIIYSVFQSFQSRGKKPQSPQEPQRPQRPFAPFPPPETKGPPGKTLADFWEELKDPEERRPAAAPATKPKPAVRPKYAEAEERFLRQTATGDKRVVPPGSPLAKSAPRPRAAILRQKKIDRQEREYVSPAPSRLLEKDNLIWGIIALEVLSPPRARSPLPFDRQKRQKGRG